MPSPNLADLSSLNVLSPGIHQGLVDRVRAIILRQLLAQLKSQMVPQLISQLVIVWLAWGSVDNYHLALWFGAFVGLYLPVQTWAFLYTKRHGIPDDRLAHWRYFSQGLWFSNALFVAYAYYFFALGSAHEDLFFLFITGTMVVLAQFSRADIRIAAVMVAPIYIAMLAAHIGRGTERDFLLAGFVSLAFLASFSLVVQQSKEIFDALYRRLLNEELVRVLERAKQEVEAASMAKSRFFAAASHDLRQPLHALTLLTHSLRINVPQQSVQPTLAHMEDALRSLKSLFENLLDISKLESGAVGIHIESVSVSMLFEKLAREFKPLADTKGLRLKFFAAGAIIETDTFLLERILRNLISNAIKYTDSGGVLVGCRLSSNSRVAKLQVFDTGIGIAAAELPNIFEDFYRASSTATREQHEGTGLGLGIVKRLVEKLDHPIAVRSEPGRGSTFTLQVPHSGKEEFQPTAISAPHNIPSLSLTGRSILVVDDDPLGVSALKTLLQDWKAQVIVARSETELQRLLEVLATPPDFVIADFQFEPSFTGEHVIRQVRERYQVTIPCAIITGNVSLIPEHVLRIPGIHIFSKPVAPGKLRALLHSSLLLPSRQDVRGIDIQNRASDTMM